MSSRLTRRGFLGLAAASASLVALSACEPVAPAASSEDEMAEGVKVHFGLNWSNSARILDQLLADPNLPDFMGDNTLEIRTSIGTEAVLAAVASGTPPDIGAIGHYVDFMARDVVVEVTDHVAASSIINEEDFIETNWGMTHHEGVQ